MRNIRIIIATVIMAVASVPAFAGKIVTEKIQSAILSAEVAYNVYLPDGYSSENHYPVIYLLHGLSDDYRAWDIKGNMKLVADELMASGECVPAVIVMPNAGGPDTANMWNGYFNMPSWSYEDFFFNEFMPAVEAKLNAGGCKGQRAVMGLSMGGGGSTVYCQRHPECFSSCYAMSAWLDNDKDNVRPHKDKDKLYYVTKAVCERSALAFVENADEATVAQLRTVKWFFDCGDDDFLFDQSVRMHQLMRGKRVKSELRIRNGVHNWEYWHTALRMSLPFASRNFSGK